MRAPDSAGAQGRSAGDLPRGAAQEDPRAAREVHALAAREPAHDRAPGSQHGLGREEQAGLHQVAQTAGAEAPGRPCGLACSCRGAREATGASSSHPSGPAASRGGAGWNATRGFRCCRATGAVVTQCSQERPGFCLTRLQSRNIRSPL
jgi:hypothetical protein